MHLSEEAADAAADEAADDLPAEVVESQPAEEIGPSGIEPLLGIPVGVGESHNVGKVEHQRKADNRKVSGVRQNTNHLRDAELEDRDDEECDPPQWERVQRDPKHLCVNWVRWLRGLG